MDTLGLVKFDFMYLLCLSASICFHERRTSEGGTYVNINGTERSLIKYSQSCKIRWSGIADKQLVSVVSR